MTTSVASNLEHTKVLIDQAAKKAERQASEITLIAVSKKQTVDDISEAYSFGQCDFGESYAQELVNKAHLLSQPRIKWHFIGHLQRNKAKQVVGLASLIHTVDRLPLAETINKLAEDKGIMQDCLVQVKLAEEESKTGCEPHEVKGLLGDLNRLKNIRIKGLMLIGTWTTDLRTSQKEFIALRELRNALNKHNAYKEPLEFLSMGMSGDFELAIAHGATHIRVGTSIFGSR
ncbi:MAG: hypothetical protein ACD_62C00608G0011 [uncultured bacterium]|nr:MAG: hypothetical protein ACD_62C00608G0011 [uncultured bacterium]HLD44961.1 YggS family pyridoxal phosphate-dependent enzyme [bacterium]